MSHFYTIVLVPRDTEDVVVAVARLLAPYDENLEVEPYDQECSCVGSEAYLDACKTADKTVGFIEEIRKSHWAIPDNQRPKWTDYGPFKRWRAAQEMAEREHPLYRKPNPACSYCGGTGVYKSTYNPKSKWDWWRIGGRWDGVIQGNYRDDGECGFNFDDDHEQLRYNVAPVTELIERFKRGDKDSIVPFALITPDGQWHESGTMGWWAIVSNEKPADEWAQAVISLYEEHRDCLAVGCDLHI